MRRALPIMFQGTHSDAGKSVIATAFCRIFARNGWKTAPFKSQNMSLNSYVTLDGKEIGRAQGVQAEAAGVVATTHMNPILIKPSRDQEAQIVVHGKPYENMKATTYRNEFFHLGLELIQQSLHVLMNEYDRLVIEGAGSPAEVNLNDRELVNMRVARMANAPVVLVGDIERGGVFASLVGTLQLLEEQDRKRVIGVIINKFRGDLSLLQPGLRWFEQYTGVKVLGVVPYTHVRIDAEDSVALSRYATKKDDGKAIDVAVIQYPRISNFTDIDPFFAEPDCSVRFVSDASLLGEPDILILPGSKNTIEDVHFLKETGLFVAIRRLYERSDTIMFGICGGYQMLGERIKDPFHVETPLDAVAGLSLLPVETTLACEKTTVLCEGMLVYKNEMFDVKGYEIHMGRSLVKQGEPLILLSGKTDGCKTKDERVIGTYMHDLFHNDMFRHHLLNSVRRKKQLSPLMERPHYRQLRAQAFDDLADCVEKHVDVKAIERKMIEFQGGEHHAL
ncbi:cobyric acid synthase [Anoxybacillus sp. LAT_35]|uniref:cobyric acid synthase n=1 Tax=unclassified Anoxybacillus TaxID=2639704 RepID=UPI001EDB8C74|nr:MULTISPECIES: cobyric acid synthase [unclassified Anoxybacillus]MCG5025395.1 cobyric acid synthase [Anoxybacillus flavithermus]MCG6196207.1 cobyric acid synthase [Anoxybacillus sp. LAT_38]MCG3083778.1 cobyric acid synthase [Anoxybacillus sp. LAT27]MCG6170420.1 cobyric acid synthase [Anoxybacillus sp. LAT_11]MCG6175368.1 cobyric acid synthase [Anoxybacillus sp. LAT_31]